MYGVATHLVLAYMHNIQSQIFCILCVHWWEYIHMFLCERMGHCVQVPLAPAPVCGGNEDQ